MWSKLCRSHLFGLGNRCRVFSTCNVEKVFKKRGSLMCWNMLNISCFLFFCLLGVSRRMSLGTLRIAVQLRLPRLPCGVAGVTWQVNSQTEQMQPANLGTVLPWKDSSIPFISLFIYIYIYIWKSVLSSEFQYFNRLKKRHVSNQTIGMYQGHSLWQVQRRA